MRGWLATHLCAACVYSEDLREYSLAILLHMLVWQNNVTLNSVHLDVPQIKQNKWKVSAFECKTRKYI